MPARKNAAFYLNGETPVTEISCKEWQNSVSRTVSLSCTGWQCWGTKSMPTCKNPAILFQWRDSSGCDFLQGMAEFSLEDSITILGWMTVLSNKIYAHMQKCCYFISMERFQWLWFLARNGRNQSPGQYHYPGIDDSPEEQNLCPHAKILLFYFNGEIPVAVISHKEWQRSITRTVSLFWLDDSPEDKIYAHMPKSCYLVSMQRFQWLWFLAPNVRNQSQGQYHYPGPENSPEEQNLCPHAKMLLFYLNGETPVTEISCKEWQNSVSRTVSLSCTGWQCWETKSMPACKNAAILFQWRDSSGCNFLQGIAEFSLEDSITILGWRTVLRNKIYVHMQKILLFYFNG